MDPFLRRADEDIRASAGHLPIEVLARASEAGWSGLEILEHLTLAFRANAAAMRKAVESGSARGRQPSTAQALGRFLVINLGYFPRVKAPAATMPTRAITPEQGLQAILDAITTLDQAITLAQERFGTRALVANHPYFGGLTTPQWAKFHWRHTAHHMTQLRERTRRRP
jgi:hypothetical protein